MNISLNKKNNLFPLFAICYLLFAICSCTFDYGETESLDSNMPDLIMQNVEYVRIRSTDPQARFFAERAERYEKQNLMKLDNFSFEQYGERGNEVNVFGSAGHARINTDSSDIFMNQGVKIEVFSEDIIMETYQLNWENEPRHLYTGEMHVVTIYRENGTRFGGIGLSADARRRTWGFSDAVGGTYIHDDKEEEIMEEEIE